MRHIKLLACAAGALMLASCGTPKDISYFQDVTPNSIVTISQPYEIKVQRGDKLRIIVTTQDERLSMMFNISPLNYTSQATTNTANQIGYTVDPNGMIDFPLVGKLEAAGKTRSEIAQMVKDKLQEKELVKEPVVTVDFLNMNVTVLGDVKNPGNVLIQNDRYTLLEAISAAGDLNITANRTNVKVMRQEVGQQRVYFVDLTNADSVYKSPVFFLQQNDVVYVDPNDKRKREATPAGNSLLTYSFWISLASLLMSAAVLIKK